MTFTWCVGVTIVVVVVVAGIAIRVDADCYHMHLQCNFGVIGDITAAIAAA